MYHPIHHKLIATFQLYNTYKIDGTLSSISTKSQKKPKNPQKTPKPMDFIPEVKVNCYKSWGKMYCITLLQVSTLNCHLGKHFKCKIKKCNLLKKRHVFFHKNRNRKHTGTHDEKYFEHTSMY